MLTIDHREQKVRDVYDGEEGVDFEVKTLAVGDFMVAYEDQPEKTCHGNFAARRRPQGSRGPRTSQMLRQNR